MSAVGCVTTIIIVMTQPAGGTLSNVIVKRPNTVHRLQNVVEGAQKAEHQRDAEFQYHKRQREEEFRTGEQDRDRIFRENEEMQTREAANI
ncbi:hypothetical protein F5880DRAFT_1619221 [Lentinula raphanica]|nr:hypothetical protein F5880DRAFT_1619221 [Lentinula raphanica]